MHTLSKLTACWIDRYVLYNNDIHRSNQVKSPSDTQGGPNLHTESNAQPQYNTHRTITLYRHCCMYIPMG